MTLQDFFRENPAVALGFSGGVDSAYLLHAAVGCGARVGAYYVKTAFQPAFELRDAQRLCRELGAPLRVVEVDILACRPVGENPPDRCYHCKKALFGALGEQARRDGFEVLVDGTNASDDAGDRPGMRALGELAVRSPLRECGITKSQVRERSRKAGLFTWDKPAYACLATRVPAGEPLSQALLKKIERAEECLFALGFSDFRVRVPQGVARLQVPASQMPLVLEKRQDILLALEGLFPAVTLDLLAR
ncbi:ATP-dependent sacrificial sulfur transferase LarE [Acutalibacter caecimuris]|uniref:ATP-dependent sacrificial sulfur transferase LarE n=1 Tax=Acutalibacter caecimuris TaxID=3093657 RepID=UPI002AC97464|nr:ATP-dependent sacrificial sulfur transferase LarE [Acutalibacter sp. M00118]